LEDFSTAVGNAGDTFGGNAPATQMATPRQRGRQRCSTRFHARRPANLFLPQAVTLGAFPEFGQRPSPAFANLMEAGLVLHADDQNPTRDQSEQAPPRRLPL
jgi:hypothetical protein